MHAESWNAASGPRVVTGVNVEIFSDVVCPWCYLGRARFEAAAERLRADNDGEVEVAWRPFQLNPDETGGGRAADGLAEKFGGHEKVAGMHAQMRELMAVEGLPYEPEQAISVNTRDAHRVIAYAGEKGVQDAVVGRLFRAYHAEGRDLNDHAVLAELSGLDGVPELLASPDGVAGIEAQLELARTIGVTGVPFFVFEGKWAVSGAQPGEVFDNALREVAAQV